MDAQTVCDELAELSLYAGRSWSVGERRTSPSGQELEGVYEHTYCTFELGTARSSDQGVVEFLRSWNQKLAMKRAFFTEIRSTGGEVDYSIGWYSEGNTGEGFDFEFLKECADLGIGFMIDYYDKR